MTIIRQLKQDNHGVLSGKNMETRIGQPNRTVSKKRNLDHTNTIKNYSMANDSAIRSDRDLDNFLQSTPVL
jgi:hypothetical protein